MVISTTKKKCLQGVKRSLAYIFYYTVTWCIDAMRLTARAKRDQLKLSTETRRAFGKKKRHLVTMDEWLGSKLFLLANHYP